MHKECRDLIADYEIKAEQRVIDSNDVGAFYRFVNKKLVCKTGIGTLRNKQGELITDNLAKANLLNEFFASAGVQDDGHHVDIERQVPDNVSLDTIKFDPGVIIKTIQRLKHKCSCDPHGFPVTMLKNLAGCLAYPLSLIFNSFMSTGSVTEA